MNLTAKNRLFRVNLIPPTPFSRLEKGEKTILWVGVGTAFLPSTLMDANNRVPTERGFRGEVLFFIKKLTCISDYRYFIRPVARINQRIQL